MALATIVCPVCSHRGFVPASNVGRVLRCRGCSHAALVRKGGQVIRSHYVEDDEDDAGVDASEDSRWAAYEGRPAGPPPKPPPAQRPRRPKKRRLMPRVPMTEGV